MTDAMPGACRHCGAPPTSTAPDGVGLRRWRSYLAGYEWGYTYGMTAGYEEAYVEILGLTDHIAARGLSRRPSHAEVVARRWAADAARGPALSAAEIRARAAASWGLTPGGVPITSHGVPKAPTARARPVRDAFSAPGEGEVAA
jgi:hypothetical protein